MGVACTPMGRGRFIAILLTTLGMTGGCSTELVMAEISSARAPSHEPAPPETTIRYTAVRAETRLYPDYGSIDRTIVVDDTSDSEAKKREPPP